MSLRERTRDPASTSRFVELDAIKAAGILAVVLIHSMRDPWDPARTGFEEWIGYMTRFAVPGFLAVSGFLYATRQVVPASTTRRRLVRILVPYLTASAAAQVFWAFREGRSPSGSIARDLLLGASFGPYYYVIQIALFVLLTPLLARLGARGLWVLFAATLLVQGAIEAGFLLPMGLFWHARNPLLWAAYFLLGWMVRLSLPGPEVLQRARTGLVVGSAMAVGVGVGILARVVPDLPMRITAWLTIYAILSLLFSLFAGRRESLAVVRTLSDLTYPIYLFHLFFLLPARSLVHATPNPSLVAATLIPWCAGLLGALLVVALARGLLGERSRTLIGA